MKSVVQFVHRLIINAGVEEIFVRLRKATNVIRKLIPIKLRSKFPSVGRFIPNASSYPTGERYSLTRDNTHFIIDRSDYVQWRLFYGVRDNALAEAKKYVHSGGIVLDIGANFGAFSLRLTSYIAENNIKNVQVHAFEPNPAVAKNYIHNLSLNPALANIVQFYQLGFGNEKAEKVFAFDISNTGAGRITKDKASHQTQISIERLDDWVDKIKPSRIAFIKLIVEGFEPEVFKGGWKTIYTYRPPIFFEVTEKWWKENNSTIEEVLNKLRGLGYHFMIEHENEMLRYEPTKFSKRTQFNLMATV